ncbi:MAG: hypothetical protein CMK32_15350 [Porticoccaceae bacterium]|nr:hypothetical protein [Porticoccaceae bacterium]
MKPLFGRFTLLQQWLGATFLAIIPLLVAVSYASLALQAQTRGQREMVKEMELLAGHTSELSDTARQLVRTARQSVLLRDSSFVALYKQKRQSLANTIDMLAQSLPDVDNRERLMTILSIADEIEAQIGQPAPDSRRLAELLQSLVSQGEALVKGINDHRRSVLSEAERAFNRIVDQVFLIAMLALPGTFLLMAIGTYMVSRPIWRLSQAIRALGRHQWEKPIEITGPSDLTALGDNLEWMRQQVNASDRQKTAFIQHVTHELKTPLAAIIEASSLLGDGVPATPLPAQRPILAILDANARNLQALIQQLLNYNAVSHGLVTQYQPVNIQALCHQIMTHLQSANPGKNIHWVVQGNCEQVTSDPRLLDMILRNLLGNAAQFCSDDGRIEVRWHQQTDHWTLSVSDNGPGIEPDELEAIFTPFYKGRSGRRDRVPKNGIGLAIVKEAVQLLAGVIRVESTPGQGATFMLRF